MQHILYTFFKNCFVKQYQLHILKCKSEQNLMEKMLFKKLRMSKC